MTLQQIHGLLLINSIYAFVHIFQYICTFIYSYIFTYINCWGYIMLHIYFFQDLLCGTEQTIGVIFLCATSNFPQLPVIFCAGLNPLGFPLISLACLFMSPLFSSHLNIHVGVNLYWCSFWCLGDTASEETPWPSGS